ncbi:hypothetical protein [Phaeodactylibacter xiamenensis]|uniref:hypothetical protein n=1 Tax=Phaeodactylibacter xiamenensis TaxID=1524460 RepID=UPI003BAB5C7F
MHRGGASTAILYNACAGHTDAAIGQQYRFYIINGTRVAVVAGLYLFAAAIGAAGGGFARTGYANAAITI